MTVEYFDRFYNNRDWKRVKFAAGRHCQSAELNEVQSILYDQVRRLGNTSLKDGQVTRNMGLVVKPTRTLTSVPWTRNGTVATVNLATHICDIGDVINVTASSSTAAITTGNKSIVTVPSSSYFTFTCLNAGATSGTITYIQNKAPNTIANIAAGSVYYQGLHHDYPGGAIEITGVGYETIGMIFTEVIVTEAEDPELMDPAIGYDPGYGLPGAHRIIYTYTLTLNDPNSTPIYKLLNGQIIVPPKVDPFEPIYEILARRTFDESGHYKVRGLECYVEALSSSHYNVVMKAGKAYVQGWEINKPVNTKIPIRRPLDSDTASDETHMYVTGTNTYTLYQTPIKTVAYIKANVTRTRNIVRGGSPGGTDTILDPAEGSIIGGTVTNVNYAGNNYTVNVHYTVTGNTISWALGNESGGAGEEPPTGATYQLTYTFTKTLLPNVDFTSTTTAVNLTMAPEKPDNGSNILVTYDPYLARFDLVMMDYKGNLSITEGSPDFDTAGENYAYPPNPPSGLLHIATIKMPPNATPAQCVVTNSTLYRMTMEELNDQKVRVSDIEYNLAVTDLENTAYNTGLTTTKKSIFTDSFTDLSKVNFGHALYTSQAVYPAIDFNRTLWPSFTFAFHSLVGATDRLVLSFTHSLIVSQTGVTEDQLVNPYAVFNSGATISLSPDDDVSINTTTITVNKSEYYPGSQLNWWESTHLPEGTWELIASNGSVYRLYRKTETEVISETKALGVSNARTVSFSGSGFIPYSDNLVLTFEGTPQDIHSPSIAGTNSGTVKADANGNITGTFDVAAGHIGGAKHVVISNANNTGEAIYTIGLINRTIRTTVTTVQIDPVAETFALKDNMLISGVDVFFTVKDPSIPVRVSINNVVNGYPGQEVLATATLTPSQVATSSNGSIPTQVRFAVPAYCENTSEYCIVIASTSDKYRVAIAKLGHTDLLTGQTVSKNPYSGVLFTSSNATTWSPDQTADLKFNLYRATFATEPRELIFNNLTVSGSFFCLYAGQHTPPGTSVTWYYSANNGAWRTVIPGITVYPGVMMTSLRIKVVIRGTTYLTPTVSQHAAVIVGSWNQNTKYICRNTDLATLGQTAYSNLNIYLDRNLPGTSSATLYYSKDEGANWISAGSPTLVTALNDGYSQYKYAITGITGSPTDMAFRIDMATDAARLNAPSIRRFMAIAS